MSKSELKVSKSFSTTKDLWIKCLAKANQNGLSLSFVICRLLEMWYNGLQLELDVKD